MGRHLQAYRHDVNENKFHPLLVAYLALRVSFDDTERHGIDAWVQRIGELHEPAVARSEHVTNRYSKSVRLLAMAGLILGRDDWAKAANEGVKRFVRKSLYPDGSSRDLKHRDSLTYHGSSLKPPMELAMLAGDDGVALYSWTSQQGASLKRSVDFLCQGKLTKTNFGREHHHLGFTMWMAGAGVKPGFTYGQTDEWSFHTVENPVPVHDLNATALHLMGISHEHLTYRFQGRDFRLTDLAGNVVKDILT